MILKKYFIFSFIAILVISSIALLYKKTSIIHDPRIHEYYLTKNANQKFNSLMKDIAEEKEYKLIEALAENIANGILKNSPAKKVLIRVKKPMALAKKNVKYTAVEIARTKYG